LALRRVVHGISSLNTTGGQWRMLPMDFGHWPSIKIRRFCAAESVGEGLGVSWLSCGIVVSISYRSSGIPLGEPRWTAPVKKASTI
jgi:hypothetical protein